MPVVTITQRKDREAARRAEGARAVMDRLQNFVWSTGHAGRFIVFGSAVAGTMRFTSDFDVIVDFPVELEAEAWTEVEQACQEWSIPDDIHSTSTANPAFIEKVLLRPVRVIS